MELDRDTLGIVLAGVFAGLAVLLAVVAIAKQPFLLFAALPFVAAAYLVWQSATGSVPFGGRTRRVSPEEARQARARRAARDPAGPREGVGQRRQRTTDQRRQRTGAGGRRGQGRQRVQGSESLARREAARVLGVDVDAEPAVVRAAYRESVKEVHPDSEGGDTEAFQRVNEAYERLQEE